MKLRNSKSGAILLVVIIISLTISLIGATMMVLYFNVLTSTQVELYRAQALYLAEAGIAQAIHFLRTQATATEMVPGSPIIPATRLGEGFFEVYTDSADSSIISEGVSHDVRRRLAFKYDAF